MPAAVEFGRRPQQQQQDPKWEAAQYGAPPGVDNNQTAPASCRLQHGEKRIQFRAVPSAVAVSAAVGAPRRHDNKSQASMIAGSSSGAAGGSLTLALGDGSTSGGAVAIDGDNGSTARFHRALALT